MSKATERRNKFMAKANVKSTAKALKKLTKMGVDTTNVVEAQIGIDKAGRNAGGVVWLETDGSIGFKGNTIGRGRNYFWKVEEIGNLFGGSKTMFGWLEIVTNGGHSVTINAMDKFGAQAFHKAWTDITA